MPRGKVHRAAVIGIDQRQVPEFGALVEIGNAGQRCFQRELAQRVQRAQQRDAAGQGLQRVQKFGGLCGIEDFRDEAPHA